MIAHSQATPAALNGRAARSGRVSLTLRQHRLRIQTRRRTSEHWWEDEEEFDGVAGEVLMPKTLYVCMVPAGSNAAPDICAVAAAATKQMRAALPNSATLTAGFTSDQVAAVADASWEALGAAGPPYFKKMRRRGGLAEPLNDQALHEALQEMLGQNWRVELDYGLQGAALTPQEHLLIMLPTDVGRALLTELVPEQPVEAAAENDAGVQLAQVDVRGWNTDASPSELVPLKSWRDLHRAYAGHAVKM